jgi:hypothetical protein
MHFSYPAVHFLNFTHTSSINSDDDAAVHQEWRSARKLQADLQDL